MVTRKKRKVLIITCILMMVIIAITILALLYLNTDMFKSNEVLFTKYIGKNMENLETFMQNFEKSEYEQLLEQNKYKSNTQVKVNYTENIGTTSESTQNVINKLKLSIEGETDQANQYNYQNIQLYNVDDNILNLEYVQDNNNYGFRFTGLFKQYLFVENSNIRQLLINAGLTEEQIAQIPDEIIINEIENPITFNQTEKQELANKYIEAFKQNISEDKYSKQSNIDIIINEERITTNAYILKLTKEELNNCYINLLETLKQDEIILGKIDNLQNLLLQYNLIDENTQIKEYFITYISNKIEEIKSVNIGQEETTITVYENNGITVSTSIETPEYKIDLDYLKNQFVKIIYSNKEEKIQSIQIENEENETNIEMINQESEEDIRKYIINYKKVIEDNKIAKTITANYEDNNNKVEANIEQDIEKVEKLESKEIIEEDNIIILNELDETRLKQVINKVTTLIQGKMEEVNTQINYEELKKVLNTVGIVNEIPKIEDIGITEAEKNRYNSKFELLQGENLQKENVLKMIETIRGNLISIEVVSNLELRLNLDRYNNNEEVVNTVYGYIENSRDRNYDIIIEYDEQTGLAKDIMLKIVTESE